MSFFPTCLAVILVGACGVVHLQHHPELVAALRPVPVQIEANAKKQVSTRAHAEAMVAEMRGGDPLRATEDSRKFDVTIEQVVPGGAALAHGCFYDVSSSVSTQPERMGSEKRWTQAGHIYLTGLPGGLVDHQKWIGWLVSNGTKTFTTALGTYRTLPAYQVVADPPAAVYKPKLGDWMKRSGRTALDQPAHR